MMVLTETDSVKYFSFFVFFVSCKKLLEKEKETSQRLIFVVDEDSQSKVKKVHI